MNVKRCLQVSVSVIELLKVLVTWISNNDVVLRTLTRLSISEGCGFPKGENTVHPK